MSNLNLSTVLVNVPLKYTITFFYNQVFFEMPLKGVTLCILHYEHYPTKHYNNLLNKKLTKLLKTIFFGKINLWEMCLIVCTFIK